MKKLILLLCLLIPVLVEATTVTLTAGDIIQDGDFQNNGDKRAGASVMWAEFNSGGPPDWCAYAEFDISSIPDGATITNVNMTVNVVSTFGNVFNANPFLTVRPSTGATVSRYTDCIDGTPYGNFGVGSGTKFLDLGSSADSDLQSQLSADWFAIGLEIGALDGWYREISTVESANDPFIMVQYTAAADSCTPPAAGNYAVDCSDNCAFSSADTIPANITATGSGVLTLSAAWTFTGSDQYINIGSGCELDISSGGEFK